MHRGHYYVWGEDPYLLDAKVEEIITKFIIDGEEAERLVIDPDELSPEELGELLEFSPLFSLSRVLIIKNPYWLTGGNRKAKQLKTVEAVWQDYFSREHEGQFLIITSLSYQASNSITRLLQKHCEIIAIPVPAKNDREKWIRDQCAARNLKASPVIIKQMAQGGQDYYYLQNLLDKFNLMGIKEIKAEQLDEDMDSFQETKVFKLSDACLQRNVHAALNAFQQLEEQGTPYLLMKSIIAGQFVQMAKVKFHHEQGYSPGQIESVLGQKAFVVKKMLDYSRNYSREEIRSLFERLLQMDISFKSESKDQRQLMEAFIVELCAR